jgi:hypothetical protein
VRLCGLQLRVTTGNSAIPAGYSIPFTFDHAAWVSGGAAAADGSDVQLWRGTEPPEQLHFVLDPDSSWNAVDTRIWFAAPADVGANLMSETLFLRFQAPSSLLRDERQVFHFADFFDRADAADPGAPWSLVEDTGNIDIVNGALTWVVAGDLDRRPLADADFDALDGLFVLDIGMNWDFDGVSESLYAFGVQLGDGPNMPVPAVGQILDYTGAGPTIGWGGTWLGATDAEAIVSSTPLATTQLVAASGAMRVAVLADVASQTYAVLHDGVVVGNSIDFASTVASLSRLRMYTVDLQEAYHSGRYVDWVIVRPIVAVAPGVSSQAVATGCGG